MTKKSDERVGHSALAPGRLADAVSRHGPAVYRLAFRNLGNRVDAERVTERVFRDAATMLNSTEDDEARRAYLLAAACSAIVDVWRAYSAGPSARPDWPLEVMAGGDEPPDHRGAPGLSRILGRLDPIQRQVLVLRLIEGRSVAETGQALGVSEADVQRLQRQSLRRATNAEPERHGRTAPAALP
ncbi:MAG: RNA polymerase sigma factor [Chloroflexota bacterium]